MGSFIDEIRDEDLGGRAVTDWMRSRALGEEMDRILSGNGTATGDMIIRNGRETIEITDSAVSATLGEYLNNHASDSVNRLLVAASESNDLTAADRGAFYFMSIISAAGGEMAVPEQLSGDDPTSVYARRVAGSFAEVDSARQNRVADFFTSGWLDRQGVGGSEASRVDRIGEYFVERIETTAPEERAAEFDRILAELSSLDALDNKSIGERLERDLTRELYSSAVYLLPPPDLALLSTREDLDTGVRTSIQAEVADRLEAASDGATALNENEITMMEALLERAYNVTGNGPAEGVVIDGVLSQQEIELINQIGQEMADGKLPTGSLNPFNQLRGVTAPEDVNLVDGVDPGEAGRIIAAAVKADIER